MDAGTTIVIVIGILLMLFAIPFLIWCYLQEKDAIKKEKEAEEKRKENRANLIQFRAAYVLWQIHKGTLSSPYGEMINALLDLHYIKLEYDEANIQTGGYIITDEGYALLRKYFGKESE